MKSKVGFILLLSIFLTSCLTNVEEPIEDIVEDQCDDVSFSQRVKPIIDNNCVSCHSAGGNFPNLTTFEGVSNHAATVKSEVVARTMPIGFSLSDSDIDAISCWVDGGALNN